MLPDSRRRLLDSIADDDIVLDIGGWADPFPRADYVLDLMPYETRGLYEREGWIEPRNEVERFDADTWLQRDICDREPFPFSDNQIDFVICSQTLEDLRDPVWVCSEIARIGNAGYIEVPSRLEEQSWGVNGPFVGWSHHRWLIDLVGQRLEFVCKLHSIHSREDQYFPAGFWHELTEAERVHALWWRGSFGYTERVFLDVDESDRYLGDFVARERTQRLRPTLNLEKRRRLRKLLAPWPLTHRVKR